MIPPLGLFLFMIIKFEDVELEVLEDPKHEWILETSQVAEGYGITDSSLRSTKSRNDEELLENKHFLVLPNATGNRTQTFWTKRGVIRLGFLIKSDKAKRFRDFCEDLVISKMETTALVPQSMEEMMILQLQGMIDTKKRVSEVEEKVKILEAKQVTRPNVFTVMGYASLNKIKIGLSLAGQLGKKATTLSNEQGYPVDRIPDPRFGTVGVYDAVILKQVFDNQMY